MREERVYGKTGGSLAKAGLELLAQVSIAEPVKVHGKCIVQAQQKANRILQDVQQVSALGLAARLELTAIIFKIDVEERALTAVTQSTRDGVELLVLGGDGTCYFVLGKPARLLVPLEHLPELRIDNFAVGAKHVD
jgi:hypothetical protein